MSLTRRDVCLLPVLVAAGTAIPAIGAQDDSMPSTVLAFESMPVRGSDRAEMRTIIKGKLATGERVAVHETALQLRMKKFDERIHSGRRLPRLVDLLFPQK